MSDSYDDAIDKVLANITRGAKKVKLADGREVEYITDAGTVETLQSLKDSAESSPFIKCGLSGRSI